VNARCRMMFSLSGKTALVTGTESGLGKSIVLSLSEQGTDIILHYFLVRGMPKKCLKNKILRQKMHLCICQSYCVKRC